MQINRIIHFAGRMPEQGKYRVAAYCRVSTDLESQQSSMEIQERVYQEMIRANPDWELAGIYADEGASGTSVKKRTAFTRMIADAEAGKIDYVITKSISRFARNTLECLQYVRHLKDIGTQLYFEKENLDTGAAFSEMLLTILAAFAQEESRSISENVKWGIRKRFEAGEERWSTCYGFTKGADGGYALVPDEAAVVKTIFSLYECGVTVNEIKKHLEKEEVPSPSGKKEWSKSIIQRMLANEKYMGDVQLQKKYTVDHLSHRQLKNHGEVAGNYLKNHHIPIVSRKTFERVAKIREMRYQGGGKDQGEASSLQYPFDEMLTCPYCGAILRRRKINVQSADGGWCCNQCGDFIIRAVIIENALVFAYNAIDMEVVGALPDSPQKELLLQYNQSMPKTQTAEYYWMEDLVDHIELGKHTYSPSDLRNKPELQSDNVVTVCWKCGMKTVTDTRIVRDADMPWHIADLYKGYLKRQENKAGVAV